MAESVLFGKKITFSSFSHLLDPRILRALADAGFSHPTFVQAKVIPLALENRDVLARARTGSGKTAAYCVPIIQKIINIKGSLVLDDPSRQSTRGLILVPTRELAEQVSAHLRTLLKYCSSDISISNASADLTMQETWAMIEKPDIVISTPARALNILQSKIISLSLLDSLVIDEADLILSYGHDDDVRKIFSGSFLPKIYQSFLMSATLTEEVELLQGLTLRNPAILLLQEHEDVVNLTQYAVRCSEVDKFLLTYVIIKLKLVHGKCILFVNSVDRSYKLKLFLEQFSIRSCVLNSELPLNSRYHTVQQFNKGAYDYIIATDESGAKDRDPYAEANPGSGFTTQGESFSEADSAYESSHRKRKRVSHSPDPSHSHAKNYLKGKDKEYGVTRGIDFIDVSCVINFDLPMTTRSYSHRVGRTARAGRTGMSLSFVVPKDLWGKDKIIGCLSSAKTDEEIFSKIEKEQGDRGSKITEYNFKVKQVEAFRYRMEDALRSVTRCAIREARIKELKTEILNSNRLKAHFEDHPLDLEYLRHDKPLHPTRIQPHMKHVPKYLLPNIVSVSGTNESVEDKKIFAPFKKFNRGTGGVRVKGKGRGSSNGRGGKKKSDPLKKFGR